LSPVECCLGAKPIHAARLRTDENVFQSPTSATSAVATIGPTPGISSNALMELHDKAPDRLLGDKGYDSDNIRNDLAERGIEPVIPPRSNRKVPIEYDRETYKRRNLIERCVNRLKQFRRIAIFRCYVLRPHSSGSKLSTRPSLVSARYIALGGFMHLARRQFLRLAAVPLASRPQCE
jgi:transposase